MLSRVFVVNVSGGNRDAYASPGIAMLTHRQGFFVLDRAFALIEGHPRYGEATKNQEKPGPPVHSLLSLQTRPRSCQMLSLFLLRSINHRLEFFSFLEFEIAQELVVLRRYVSEFFQGNWRFNRHTPVERELHSTNEIIIRFWLAVPDLVKQISRPRKQATTRIGPVSNGINLSQHVVPILTCQL